MVMDIMPKVIYDMLGHDGSEIIYPDLKDPYRRRSFHIQEMISVALKLGFVPCPIDKDIIFGQMVDKDGVEIEHPQYALTIERHLEHYLALRPGVIQTPYHAVAWNHQEQRVYDPAGQKRDLNDVDVITFWAMF
jgi:hypothetical protein